MGLVPRYSVLRMNDHIHGQLNSDRDYDTDFTQLTEHTMYIIFEVPGQLGAVLSDSVGHFNNKNSKQSRNK